MFGPKFSLIVLWLDKGQLLKLSWLLQGQGHRNYPIVNVLKYAVPGRNQYQEENIRITQNCTRERQFSLRSTFTFFFFF